MITNPCRDWDDSNKLRTPWPTKLANIRADSEHRPSAIHAWSCDGAESVIFTQGEQNGPSISELHCIEQVQGTANI